jgi:uncharacterized protein (DUF2147 family)
MNIKYFIVTIFFAFIFQTSIAQSTILGVWYNTAKTGKVEITEKNGKYYGKIIWLKEPLDEKTKKPKTDTNNPDEKKHANPIIGLQVLKDFTFKGDGVYENGTIYDPENGKTYSCKMTLKSKNELDVRGFIGFSLLGRTENWTRTTK